MLPCFRRGEGTYSALFITAEDKELTTFLTARVEECYSLSYELPACFYCHSHNVVLRYRGRPPNGTPYFTCHSCGRGFSRRTGTPLEGFHKRETLKAFLPLLSQQISLARAAADLGVTKNIMARWVRIFRAWLLELDPSGQLHAKVRLGSRPSLAHISCPRCDTTGQLGFYGYVERGKDKILKRQLKCKSCRRISNHDFGGQE